MLKKLVCLLGIFVVSNVYSQDAVKDFDEFSNSGRITIWGNPNFPQDIFNHNGNIDCDNTQYVTWKDYGGVLIPYDPNNDRAERGGINADPSKFTITFGGEPHSITENAILDFIPRHGNSSVFVEDGAVKEDVIVVSLDLYKELKRKAKLLDDIISEINLNVNGSESN